MRYKYKVRELTLSIHTAFGNTNPDDDIYNVGETKEMEAMSLKKLRKKLDHKKEYHIEYKNKKNNFISTTTRGIEPK